MSVPALESLARHGQLGVVGIATRRAPRLELVGLETLAHSFKMTGTVSNFAVAVPEIAT